MFTLTFPIKETSRVSTKAVFDIQKTKPTQHSVRGLRSLGLTPNIIACRSTTVSLSLSPPIYIYIYIRVFIIYLSMYFFISSGLSSSSFEVRYLIQALEDNVKEKLSRFCHVPVLLLCFKICIFIHPNLIWATKFIIPWC